jgi:hypothetical protein
MKKIITFLFINVAAIILSAIVFVGCTKEGPMGPAGATGPIGPAGPAGVGTNGKDGVNGKDGLNGKDGIGVCLKCHTQANISTKEFQFELSDKGARGARAGKYCARCHSTEGFQEIIKMASFNPSNEMENATKHGCSTCHEHSSFDFSGDTISQILLTTDPVYSNFDNYNNTTNAYERKVATDYKGVNNLCANCHQYRGATVASYIDTLTTPTTATKVKTPVKYTTLPYFPIANTTAGNENTLVKFRAGTSFGIHEGANQADYLISKNGYEYKGKTYTRTTAHSGYTCTQCHFNKYSAADSTGGHTMRVNINDSKCTGCHTLKTKIPATLATINTKLTELGDLLVAKKLFKKTTNATSGAVSYSAVPSHDFYGTLLPNTTSTAKYALTISQINTVGATSGLLTYNSMINWAADATSTATVVGFADRKGSEWKYGELGAAWNYTYVNTVATATNKGIHNNTYALELLQTSIDYLKSY